MKKIEWCFKKNGLKFVEPNKNLTQAYLKKAENSLRSMREVTSMDWKISAAYYAIYFSVYSVFMRFGLKSEIHSCTIEFTRVFLKSYFSKKEIKTFKEAFDLRIEAQYNVSDKINLISLKNLESEAPEFFIKCKNLVSVLTQKDIIKIRSKPSLQLF